MSVSASIDLRMQERTPVTLSCFAKFLQGDWHPFMNEQLTYLPLGDGGRYEWLSRPSCDYSSVLEEIQAKWGLREIVGIQLFWNVSGCGGEFLFFPDGLISMACSVNRRVCATIEVTDASWYIERLVSAWNVIGCKVESIVFSEQR